MKLGYNTGYWSSGPPDGVEEVVQECDKLGFEHIWTAEAYGSDALSPLAWWGSHTENVKLGTAIMQMSARTPAATAMAATTPPPTRAATTAGKTGARALRPGPAGVWSSLRDAPDPFQL